MIPRQPSAGEQHFLNLIRLHLGEQNTWKQVVLDESDRATIFAKGRDGCVAIMVNLTNLADLRTDGTIPTDDELVRDWLRIG